MINKFRDCVSSAHFHFAASFVGMLLSLCVQGQAQTHQTFWTGESQGYKITWSDTELVGRKAAETSFSARDFAKAGLAHYVRTGREGLSGKMPACTYERHFRLMAVVGTLMSFSDRYYASCPKEAHPGGETRFTTIDLAASGMLAYKGRDSFGVIKLENRGKALVLTDLFPSQLVYERLRAAPLVLRLLAQEPNAPKPQNLAELMEQLSGKLGEGDDCVSVPKDLLTRFAIRRVDGEKTSVSLGFPGAGPCRDALTLVDLQFASSGMLKSDHSHGMEAAAFSAGVAGWDEGTKETIVILHTNSSSR